MGDGDFQLPGAPKLSTNSHETCNLEPTRKIKLQCDDVVVYQNIFLSLPFLVSSSHRWTHRHHNIIGQ